MEVSDRGQNEISTKASHLHQHISKSRGLGEKQKNESQNSLVRPYLPAPCSRGRRKTTGLVCNATATTIIGSMGLTRAAASEL